MRTTEASTRALVDASRIPQGSRTAQMPITIENKSRDVWRFPRTHRAPPPPGSADPGRIITQDADVLVLGDSRNAFLHQTKGIPYNPKMPPPVRVLSEEEFADLGEVNLRLLENLERQRKIEIRRS